MARLEALPLSILDNAFKAEPLWAVTHSPRFFSTAYRFLMSDVLFMRLDVHGVLEGLQGEMRKRVDELSSTRLLREREDDLVAALMFDLKIDVPVVEEGSQYIVDEGETPVDVRYDPNRFLHDRSEPLFVPGHRLIVAVPFRGNPQLFEVRPSSYDSMPPHAEVVGQELRFTFIQTTPDAQVVTRELATTITSIKAYLARLEDSVGGYNHSLASNILQRLQARKERLRKQADMVTALGIPLKKRPDAPTTYAVSVKRRSVTLERSGHDDAAPLDPTLPQEEYEEILRIVGSMVRVIERSPKVFAACGEEDLRSHFLVQLNGQYEGRATGETFNAAGKTDILIRENNQNVFIAECKFWHGEKATSEAIDQLLGYVTWRDTKTALLVFNRNKGFSTMLASLREAVERHPCFVSTLTHKDSANLRYLFRMPSDPARRLYVAVLAFDVPGQQ